MTPTGIEKLILIMLSDIQEKLGIENGVDTKLLKSAIYNNYFWALCWAMPGIFDASTYPAPPEVDEVRDILEMWRFIEQAYATFDESEKAKVVAGAAPFGTYAQFGGFDGNEETEHFGIARFLIEDLGRFAHFKDHGLNSHSPVIEIYRRMLAVFKPIRKTLGSDDLTADQVIALVKAMKYEGGD